MEEKTVEINPIRTYIHKFYPPMKQGEDEKWTTFHKTMLSAEGVSLEEIDKNIVNQSTMILNDSKSLHEAVEEMKEEHRESYEKLFKIGVRTGWSYGVITEGTKALEEGREPTYDKFPNI
jgi:hypothetical protein